MKYLLVVLISSIFFSHSQAVPPKAQKNCVKPFGLTPKQLAASLKKKSAGKFQSVALDPAVLGPVAQEIIGKLNQKMIGHEELKIAFAQAVQEIGLRSKSDQSNISTFFLMGVTGTGKTLAAKALQFALGNEPKELIRLDGAEYNLEHNVARLTGSPSGYIGHDSTPPFFTKERLDNSLSAKFGVRVILIDEFEKAARSLENIFLPIIDDARMTTGSNEVLDFNNTIFIFTSNVGQGEIQKILSESTKGIGFSRKKLVSDGLLTKERINEAALGAFSNRLSPEFRNRVDKTFVFQQHSQEESEQIFDLQLAQVQVENFFSNAETQILFNVSPEARRWMMKEGYRKEFGGRSLKKVVEHFLVTPLTNLIASDQLYAGDVVGVDVAKSSEPKASKLSYTKIATGRPIKELYTLYQKIYGAEMPQINPFKLYTYPMEFEIFRMQSLKAMTDARDVSEAITQYALRSTGKAPIDDQIFLELFGKFSDVKFFGTVNGTYINEIMKNIKRDWQPLVFEPNILVYFFAGLGKIKYVYPENKKKLVVACSALIDRIKRIYRVKKVSDEIIADIAGVVLERLEATLALPPPPVDSP